VRGIGKQCERVREETEPDLAQHEGRVERNTNRERPPGLDTGAVRMAAVVVVCVSVCHRLG
jgi:hypothetical protein